MTSYSYDVPKVRKARIDSVVRKVLAVQSQQLGSNCARVLPKTLWKLVSILVSDDVLTTNKELFFWCYRFQILMISFCFSYTGRQPESAPASGSKKSHMHQQQKLLDDAFRKL